MSTDTTAGRPNDSVPHFDYTEHPLPDGTVVDASAGTGKTYAVAAHVTLALAAAPKLSIGQILVTTFTRNAAAELRDRVRRRIVSTAALLRGEQIEPRDELDRHLLAGRAGPPLDVAARLERAAAEFDTATIATIHAVCRRVLACAGIPIATDDAEDARERILAEVVNDEVVKEAVAGRTWPEDRILELVDTAARDPFMKPWVDPDYAGQGAELLRPAAELVARCVVRVHEAMRAHPSFDDLLRLAWEAVNGTKGAAVVAQLRERFTLAIVDEAQDTDPLQWKLFRLLFPGGDKRQLITVGDPKQAIYGFRGADVNAYVEFTRDARRRTLPVNRRSDRPLVETLNRLMRDAVFLEDEADPGAAVRYEQVEADDRAAESRVVGVEPVEVLDLGTVNNQQALAEPTVRKIVELLDPAGVTLRVGEAVRPVNPGDICVIVRTKSVGNQIAARLARSHIRAVTAGTSSVMKGIMAGDIRALLEAMERPSNLGRIRRVAATRFFGGHSLRDAGTLAEAAIRPVQDTVARFAALAQRRGIAACGAAIAADEPLIASVTAGPEGQRHLADLAHVIELLHEHGPTGGCRPDELLATFARLERLNDEQEVVVRRVESDDDAVTIMTVHAAKGLEFPCVIVADLWKAERGGNVSRPGVFHLAAGEGGEPHRTRVVDVAYAINAESRTAADKVARLTREEQKRLLYVAVTRAKHHLCVLSAQTSDASVLGEVIRNDGILTPRRVDDLPSIPDRWTRTTATKAPSPGIAPLPVGGVRQSYWRTSFTGITAQRKKQVVEESLPAGGGYDEESDAAVAAVPEPPAGEPAAAADFALPDLPAGTAFGSVIHEIFERIDTRNPLEKEVRAVVAATATSGMFDGHHATVADTIIRAMQTPFGGPLGDACFADVSPEDRLAELDFEMALAGIDASIKASDVGRVFAQVLPPSDPLHGYAHELADRSFDIPLAGLINGSIDAVLRLGRGGSPRPRLVIADYKTNKLHTAEMPRPEEAYAAEELAKAMAEHHYPLQAAVYGTAVYRMLRWRLREEDPSDCIAGIVYAFLRGTRGPDGPADAAGRRHGMFVWQPPRELWSRLSRLFGGERP